MRIHPTLMFPVEKSEKRKRGTPQGRWLPRPPWDSVGRRADGARIRPTELKDKVDSLGNWAGLLAMLLLPGSAFGYRIAVEEATLLSTLGEPYARYMRRAWRLIPYLL